MNQCQFTDAAEKPQNIGDKLQGKHLHAFTINQYLHKHQEHNEDIPEAYESSEVTYGTKEIPNFVSYTRNPVKGEAVNIMMYILPTVCKNGL